MKGRASKKWVLVLKTLVPQTHSMANWINDFFTEKLG